MISREELRRLAEFESRHPSEVAVTFYFQPSTPKDKSHREEAITAKDLVRRTLQELESNGHSREAASDLQRILQLAGSLHGNQARGKAVFACSARNVWHEFDVPPLLSATDIFVNRRFHLKPVASLLSEYPRFWVVLIDRQAARFLSVDFDQIALQGELSNPGLRHGRSDEYAGQDEGHSERHLEDEVRRHFAAAAELLKNASERKQFDALIIGCRDVNWPELQSHLHPDVLNKVAGRLPGDFGTWTDERSVAEANRVLQDSVEQRRSALLRETLDEARGNARGVTGLRRVLRALEMGEIDTILMSRDYSSKAVECTNCRHIDSHLVPYCPVCGRATRQLEDVCEALVPSAVRSNVGLITFPSDETLDRVGNIAALLRFRADRNTNQLLAAS